MKVTPFINTDKTPTLLCLGEFDSLHFGHKSIIQKAKQGLTHGQSLAVLTFKNDASAITQKKAGLVFTFEERLKLFEELGVDEVIYIEFDQNFACITPERFLNEIFENRNINALFCGSDYRFGIRASGDVKYLKSVCENKKIPLFICDFLLDESGNKISTGQIKQHLESGNIALVNQSLGTRFFVSGKVIEGRKVGRKLGFPTANILLSSEKFKFKRGVYACTVIIDDKKYRAITNVGTQPTFEQTGEVVECFVSGYSGNLYDSELKIYFDEFIREIKKFDSIEQLIEQLHQDLKVIK